MNGINHPSESIHVFHVGRMRIKLCKGKTTISKEYFSASMQVFYMVFHHVIKYPVHIYIYFLALAIKKTIDGWKQNVLGDHNLLAFILFLLFFEYSCLKHVADVAAKRGCKKFRRERKLGLKRREIEGMKKQ